MNMEHRQSNNTRKQKAISLRRNAQAGEKYQKGDVRLLETVQGPVNQAPGNLINAQTARHQTFWIFYQRVFHRLFWPVSFLLLFLNPYL